MSPTQDLVILFARYPSPGRCKTRLIPQLGPERAALIHRQLVAHTLKTLTLYFSGQENGTLLISYHGGSRQQMEQWLGNGYHYREQQGSDLGQRMANALIEGLQTAKNCLLLGSDCPDITPAILSEALLALKKKDMVLGPAHDGGYYLIGLADTVKTAACRHLFAEIPWGRDTVFANTLDRAEELGLAAHILEKLHDIDDANDLRHFHHCSHAE